MGEDGWCGLGPGLGPRVPRGTRGRQPARGGKGLAKVLCGPTVLSHFLFLSVRVAKGRGGGVSGWLGGGLGRRGVALAGQWLGRRQAFRYGEHDKSPMTDTSFCHGAL